LQHKIEKNKTNLSENRQKTLEIKFGCWLKHKRKILIVKKKKVNFFKFHNDVLIKKLLKKAKRIFVMFRFFFVSLHSEWRKKMYTDG